MDMIAPGAIERIIEDRVIVGLCIKASSDAVERIGAAPINDVSAFRHTPLKDSGHGCIVQLDSGEEFAITIRRLEN